MRRKLNATEKSLLESIWIAHTAKCRACALYNPDEPASLAHTCLQGAPVIKELLVYQAERERSSGRRKQIRAFKKNLAEFTPRV